MLNSGRRKPAVISSAAHSVSRYSCEKEQPVSQSRHNISTDIHCMLSKSSYSCIDESFLDPPGLEHYTTPLWCCRQELSKTSPLLGLKRYDMSPV